MPDLHSEILLRNERCAPIWHTIPPMRKRPIFGVLIGIRVGFFLLGGKWISPTYLPRIESFLARQSIFRHSQVARFGTSGFGYDLRRRRPSNRRSVPTSPSFPSSNSLCVGRETLLRSNESDLWNILKCSWFLYILVERMNEDWSSRTHHFSVGIVDGGCKRKRGGPVLRLDVYVSTRRNQILHNVFVTLERSLRWITVFL